jgi:serine protease
MSLRWKESRKKKQCSLAVPRFFSLMGLMLLLAPRPLEAAPDNPGSSVVPKDEYYAWQWNLKSIELDKAWQLTKGSDSVVVAVVGPGVKADHPELKDRVLPGYDFIFSEENAGDKDGWDADASELPDESDHPFIGTELAGIIAAQSNNTHGMVGIDWQCKILPVRVLYQNSQDADIADGIRWAAGLAVEGAPANPHPARIIFLPLGGEGKSDTLSSGVQDALAKGAIVITMVGNSHTDAKNFYPAAEKGVIAVAASTKEGQLASYSSYGSVVDIMAPGGDQAGPLPTHPADAPSFTGVLGPSFDKTSLQPSYRGLASSSVAAATVAGVVSLMLSLRPMLTAAQVEDVLKTTANGTTQCSEGCGAGVINAASALRRALEVKEASPAEAKADNPETPRANTVPSRGCSASPIALSPWRGSNTMVFSLGWVLLLWLSRRKR